jgi:hypothetical protein
MAKKRIPEVPRDGSDADFVPENYMLIDGAEGSAKMRMDLFGKASTDEELDEVKYEKPEGGIPKTDLAEGVQGSLALADSALQASDIEGKAEKSEMTITNVPDDTTKKTIQLKDGLSQVVVVDHQDISGKAEKSEMTVSAVSGDDTKKTIQLKSGLTQNVVIEHQDISGKADTSAMSITNVSGDATKKTIQLKTGLSQDVVVDHQDISGKAEKSEMSISAGEDDTKRIIQLKNGTSQSVVVSHQNISGKADASEMNITAVAGDETKKKIQLKSDLSQNVVIEHQDISGKAEKSEMSISAVSGDETKMKIQLKTGTSQNVVIEHQNISGKADKDEMDITAVAGDDTKKTIQLKSGLSQDVVIDVSGKADATDVLTSWQPVAAAPATGKLEFHSTRYPTRTEIVLKDATRPGGTVAEDVVVGYTVPSIELGNVGKYLMVDGQLGTSWQSVEHTLSYPSDTEGEYSTLRGVISFQTDNTPLRTSAYLAASNYEPTCLGMFVPPVKREDDGRILIVDENEGPVWRDPPSTDTEWEKLNPYTQTYGVLKFVTSFIEEETNVWVNHHTSAYIGTVDVPGWVGEFLPHFETSDSGKILMVSPTRGPEWVSMPDPETTWNYGDSDTRQGTLSVGTTFESDAPHHSSAYIEYNSSTTWLGAFVPPTDIGDIGKALMVDATRGVEWKNIPDPDIESLMPAKWKTLLDSAANAVGDHLHHTFISVDSDGNARFGRAERLFWEWTFRNPSVIATSEDISNGYVDFVFPLGETGMQICENGNLIMIKGFDLQMGNILNGKQLTFLLRGTSGSPTIILDSGFSTYTESIVNNYQWKAFKSFGLTSNRNVSHFNAVLRVPIESSTEPGTEIDFAANITVSMFGVASNDTIS